MTVEEAAALREVRDTFGLSWAETAKLFGVSEATIRHWVEGSPMAESNRRRLDLLVRRARRLGYSPSDVPTLLRRWCAEARRGQPPVFRLSDTLDVADGTSGVGPYEVVGSGPMPEPTRWLP